ncbi:MAG: flippase-like domain-containing protein [Desulfobacteraceae bacterium]|nr:flippase-like domain-containing protein [Desulfobacteraceae bacterium]
MKTFLRLLIPIVFFGFVFSIIKPSDIAAVFAAAEWEWFGIGCLCMVIGNYLCSLRTRGLLFNSSQSLWVLWHIHALRALIAGALPFSTGELSYVYYLKKYCVTPTAQGLAFLVSIRFLEFTMFLCLLFLLAVSGIFMDASALNLTALLIIAAMMAIVCLAVWKTDTLLNTFTKISDILLGKFSGKQISEKIALKIEQFSKSVKEVFTADRRNNLMSLTFGIVLVRNIFVISMIRAMGVQISVWFIVFLFLFLFVTRFVQGFGSFGNQEAGISGALIVVGYTKEEALAIAIGTHLLQWVPILILGAISYIGIQRSK